MDTPTMFLLERAHAQNKLIEEWMSLPKSLGHQGCPASPAGGYRRRPQL